MYVTLYSDEHQSLADVTEAASKNPISKKLRAGSNLYYEGDEVTQLYLVETGVVRLTRVLEDGRQQVIAFGYPGDLVGFPSNGKHRTNCDALVASKVQPINSKHLEDGSENPQLHRALLDAAIGEISAMQDHFMMLGCKKAPEKVASLLLALVERCGDWSDTNVTVELPMSRSDIADFLGLTTETVSRIFTALRKGAVIGLKGVHTVEVLSLSELERRAKGEKSDPKFETTRLLAAA